MSNTCKNYCEEIHDKIFEKYATCLVSSQAGVYIAKTFCTNYDGKLWHMPKSEARICRDIQKVEAWLEDRYGPRYQLDGVWVLNGPGNDILSRMWGRYWDAWEVIEDQSHYEGSLSDDGKVTSWRLESVDGDLFAVPRNLCNCDECCNVQCKGQEVEDAATD